MAEILHFPLKENLKKRREIKKAGGGVREKEGGERDGRVAGRRGKGRRIISVTYPSLYK